MTDLVTSTDLPVSVTETSWTPDRQLTFEEWETAGTTLLRVGRAWQWWVGDWIRYGESNYGEMYSQAVDMTGFDWRTLANVVSVAKRIESSRRREHLSWSHHAEVANLDAVQQSEWLERADTEGMTVQRLRGALRGEAPKPGDDDVIDLRPSFDVETRFRVRADDYEGAQVAAAKHNERLPDVFYTAVKPK